MNPLDLAKQAAGENDTSLREVSPVYADLAAIAASVTPAESTPPNAVDDAEAALQERTAALARVSELRDLADGWANLASWARDMPYVNEHDKFETFVTLAGLHDGDEYLQEAIKMATEMSGTPADVHETNQSSQRASAFIRILAVHQTPEMLDLTMTALSPDDSFWGSVQRMKLTPHVAALRGKTAAYDFVRTVSSPLHRYAARAYIAVHFNDQELLEQLRDFDSDPQVSNSDRTVIDMLIELYKLDRSIETKQRIEAIAYKPSNEDRRFEFLEAVYKIACTEADIIQLESVESILDPQKVLEICALYARVGAFDKAREQLNTIVQNDSNEQQRQMLLSTLCKEYARHGRFDDAQDLYDELDQQGRNEVLRTIIPLLVPYDLDRAQSLIDEVPVTERNVAMARLARAIEAHADAMEAEIIHGEAQA